MSARRSTFSFQTVGTWVPTDRTEILGKTTLLAKGDERSIQMTAVGKKLAGRILQGTTWDNLPRPPAAIGPSQLHKPLK